MQKIPPNTDGKAKAARSQFGNAKVAMKPTNDAVKKQSSRNMQAVGDMRKRLEKIFSLEKKRNSKNKEQTKPTNVTFSGLSFPFALSALASSWLGSSTPTKSALTARFGKQPSEEAIYALASELGADIEVHSGKIKDLKNIQAPYIAELSDGNAIVILSISNDSTIKCFCANGTINISMDSFLNKASGNWVSVYEKIKKSKLNSFKVDPSANIKPNFSTPYNDMFKSNYARISRLASLTLKGSMKDFKKMLMAAGLSNSLLIVLPLFITIVYDRVVPHGAFETLTALTIGVLLALGIDVGLRSARVNLQETIGVKAGLRLQSRAYRKLVSIELEKGQQVSKGFFTLLPEIEHAALLTPGILAAIFADLPFVIIMLGLIYVLTGPVVLVPIFGIAIIIATVVWGNLKAKKLASDTHEARIEVQNQAIETCATLATAKATRSEHKLLNSWARKTDSSAFLSHQSRQSMAMANQFVMNITQMTIVLTIVAGAVQVNAGAMTLGNLAAATLLVGRIISPVSQLISQLGQFANIQSSIDNIFALLDEEEEFGGDENASRTNKFKGNITFTKVNFAYAGAERQSLSDVSIKINAGEKVGVIGRNGGGKSTLLKMVPRFYLPQNGSITLDDVDARQISPFMLRQSIGFMSQDTVLMNDTIRANICAGAGEVSDEEFERAVNISGVAQFTKTHPHGYNLNVGPRGEHLSGGERQAVGLARAILQNPNVLLLDEPTSAMDNSAEDRLIKELPHFLGNKTVLIATHRMQLLKLVDRIIWMDGSRIIADGPKDEVLSNLKKTG